jgi:hypothetical protein
LGVFNSRYDPWDILVLKWVDKTSIFKCISSLSVCSLI